jgi:uncharacterized MAPEG superfamily protein
MEYIFASFSLKINPVASVAYALIVAYLPQFYKREFVVQKLLKNGIAYTIAHSRHATTIATDDSQDGKFIALLTGCHYNGLEAFGYYSTAIGLSIVTKVPNDVISGAAGLFLTARVLYVCIYLSPLNGLPRTLCWGIGILTSLALIFISSSYYAKNL